MHNKTVKIRAYGKINLFLDCLRRREDGYHDIQMIMQSVRLHDVVELKQSKYNTVSSDSQFVPSNKNNLALKAAVLMQEHYNIPNVSIRIKKNIPVSAGMAGGSTDAAAVLMGCNSLFDLGLSNEELMNLGGLIGSDVPFCVLGGTATAEGRGEIVTPIADLPKSHVILVRADYGVSTASVYKAIDPNQIHPNTKLYQEMLAAINNKDLKFIVNNLYNSLEIPSFSLDNRTEKRKKMLQEAGITHILMSGSGPTLFSMYENEYDAWQDYKIIKRIFPSAYLTSTCSSDLIGTRITIH